MGILVIDVGTSGLRAALVERDGTLRHEHHRRLPPETPFPGLVEFDANVLAEVALDLARAVLAESGPVEAVGVANQRASTILWDAATGRAVGPALGWQDLRTAGDCLALQADGLRLAPNQSATKLAHLLALAAQAGQVPTEQLRFGTVDSWLVWQLSGGAAHVTDLSNAGVTGLLLLDASGWDEAVLQHLGIPASVLPSLADSVGQLAEAAVLPGRPPITAILGDQQASLLGQGCVTPGAAKITFGTGAMLDVFLGDERPAAETRGPQGTFPIVALGQGGRPDWGLEAIMLAAGSNVDWLRDDLGLLREAAESGALAAEVPDADGVVFVPHLLGEGTPGWDLGARGTLLGLTRGSDRRHICRAVLEGVAHGAADLVEAAEADAGRPLVTLRVDGGMTANTPFVQAVADATGRPIEVSPQREATALGAGLLAGLGAGWFGDLADVGGLFRPATVVEPSASDERRSESRARWQEARRRAAEWYPELSALSF